MMPVLRVPRLADALAPNELAKLGTDELVAFLAPRAGSAQRPARRLGRAVFADADRAAVGTRRPLRSSRDSR